MNATKTPATNAVLFRYIGIAAGILLLLFLLGLMQSGSAANNRGPAAQATPFPDDKIGLLPHPSSGRLQPDPGIDPDAAWKYVQFLARKHGTNYEALSSDDRLLLSSLSMGHGRELLKKTVSILQEKERKARSGAVRVP